MKTTNKNSNYSYTVRNRFNEEQLRSHYNLLSSNIYGWEEDIIKLDEDIKKVYVNLNALKNNRELLEKSLQSNLKLLEKNKKSREFYIKCALQERAVLKKSYPKIVKEMDLLNGETINQFRKNYNELIKGKYTDITRKNMVDFKERIEESIKTYDELKARKEIIDGNSKKI